MFVGVGIGDISTNSYHRMRVYTRTIFSREHVTTETYGFKPHSVPTTEILAEPTPQELATSSSTLKTEPLLLQLATPKTLPKTLQDHAQHCLIPRPPEYELWSNNKKYNWRRKFEHK